MNRTNCMAQHIKSYLALRRAFGFQLVIAGEQLQDFARFADRTTGRKPLTLELALRWAQSSPTGKQTSAARRLLILRPFIRYLRTLEPQTEIPPHRILGPAQHRYVPHIYTDQEIAALLEVSFRLRPRGGLRALSVGTYLRLLLCTGMRPPEPLRLTRADVDFQSSTLTVRQTKFSDSSPKSVMGTNPICGQPVTASGISGARRARGALCGLLRMAHSPPGRRVPPRPD